MPYPVVRQPLTGPDAFAAQDAAAVQAQAAILLLLGQQLHGDAPPVDTTPGVADAALAAAGSTASPGEFPVPVVRHEGERFEFLPPPTVSSRRNAARTPRLFSAAAAEATAVLPERARTLYEQPSPR